MHARPDEAPLIIETEDGTIRGHEWGGMVASINRLNPGTDLAPLLGALKAGGCDVPHWGYVLEGSLTIGHSGGEIETVTAGDIFHAPAVHDTVHTSDGCAFVEFSPAAELGRLMDEIAAVMEEMEA